MSEFDPYHQWLGIPETARPISKYRLLAIEDFEADRGVISAAAEQRTIYLRTMQAGEHAILVAELLNEVSQARVTLLNADQKAEYDEELRKQQTPEPVPEPTPPPIPVVQTPTPTPVVVRGTVTQEFPVSVVQAAKRPRRRQQKEFWKQTAVIGVSVVGVIGVFVLVISMMSSGDADPVASNTADQNSAEMAVDKAASDKAEREKAAADKAAMEKAAMEKAAAEKAAADKAAADKAAADKAAADKAAADKAAMEQAAADKAAMEKADAEKAAAVTAALARGDWKTALSLDRDNSEGKQMQGIAEKSAADKAALDAAKRKAAVEAKKKAEEILARDPIINSIRMKLKLIPAGTFTMGSPEGVEGRGYNEHQHQVTISKPLYMQTTEVTQGQWKAVMGTEPWKGKQHVKEGPNYAATYVSWDDAVEYCEKLGEREGKTYRLPTEAEWEYACRAGTKTTWSFGDDEKDLGDYAWYRENAYDIGERYAHQVGLKHPNAFGLYDMHGNVKEWCHDYFGEDFYKWSSDLFPRGPPSGSLRVLRGGSWLNLARRSRSAGRLGDVAGFRNYYYGFRLVRELD